jgi:molybdopterin-guanine dinucleotide biosynthesis protein A
MIGLVLAVVEGRRYGRPKAGVVDDGERHVDRAVRVLREAATGQSSFFRMPKSLTFQVPSRL